MMLKSLKFWHNWFKRAEPPQDEMQADSTAVDQRKHPSAVTIRAALRQKHRTQKAPAQ